MNLEKALALADQESQIFVGRPEVKCPFDKTGLLVLVYRDDTKDAIKAANVKLSGKSRTKRNREVPVAGLPGNTDRNGIVHDYKPCAPGEYDVTVTGLPGQGKLYAKPYPTAHQSVPVGTCPVCSLPVEPRKYWVKVRLVEKDSGKDIESAEVKIKLAAGWKSAAGEEEETQATEEEGAGPHKKRIAHFKDITAGTADADKCKIDSVDVETALEFVEISSA
jgi:hypothetical protein